MVPVCIRSIDTNPIQPLLAYPVFCGKFRAATDYPEATAAQQQTRSRDASFPTRTGGPTTCAPWNPAGITRMGVIVSRWSFPPSIPSFHSPGLRGSLRREEENSLVLE